MAEVSIAETASTPGPGPATDPNLAPSPAVARCLDACTRVFDAELALSGDRMLATCAAHKAYRNAMPPLTGLENIRDFVACVAQGMLRNVFQGAECSKFLYAAQVAVGVDRHEPKPPKPAALPWPCKICRGADQFVPGNVTPAPLPPYKTGL